MHLPQSWEESQQSRACGAPDSTWRSVSGSSAAQEDQPAGHENTSAAETSTHGDGSPEENRVFRTSDGPWENGVMLMGAADFTSLQIEQSQPKQSCGNRQQKQNIGNRRESFAVAAVGE